MNPSQKTALARRVSWQSIWMNTLLSILKFAAGLIAHSSAMLSDAVHSASDVFSSLTVLIGIKLAARPDDADHEYGHERLESLAAVLLAAVLAATGCGIGYNGLRALLRGGPTQTPGLLALLAAVLSIAVKEAMYWYTRHAARKVDSAALMADAWHHRSDALSSVGALIAIAGARMGLPLLDPLACLIICLFILKASLDIFRQAARQLTDRSCPAPLEERMRATALRQDGVERLDLLHTRQFASRVYVDVEIAADGSLPLYQAHAIAQRVHDAVEREFPQVKHCMVHVNPIAGATPPQFPDGTSAAPPD